MKNNTRANATVNTNTANVMEENTMTNTERKVTVDLVKVTNVALTHNGLFHCDDVFSAALLRYINPDIKFVRSNTVPEDFNGIVFDVGGGRYDHHQEGAKVREDSKVKYAAFGLLWNDLGFEILGDDSYLEDELWVQSMDHSDNTGEGRGPLQYLFGAMNPCIGTDQTPDSQFELAVKVATILLTARINSILAKQKMREELKGYINKSNDRVLVMEHFVPWQTTTVCTEFRFVVYPSNRTVGEWTVQSVPFKPGTNDSTLLPTKMYDEFISGENPEISFIHKNRFICQCRTKSYAVMLARLAWAEYKERGWKNE